MELRCRGERDERFLASKFESVFGGDARGYPYSEKASQIVSNGVFKVYTEMSLVRVMTKFGCDDTRHALRLDARHEAC